MLGRTAKWLTMLDSNGHPMITFFTGTGTPLYPTVPFNVKTSSDYTTSLAFGLPGGNNAFMVVWSGAGSFGGTAWPGIWADSIGADQLVYSASASYPQKGHPVSYINQDAFYATDVPTWVPTVCYNVSTDRFFCAWRETPANVPNSTIKVNHIRGDWVSRNGLMPNSPNFVLSSTGGGEDPQYPSVASSTKEGKVLVVWNDMRNAASGGTDVYGMLVALDQSSPNQPASFKVIPYMGTSVALIWTTLSETNNYGFEVQRRPANSQTFSTIPGSYVAGMATCVIPRTYAYVDTTATPGEWWYRLKQIDMDQTIHYSSAKRVDVLTGVAEESAPVQFALHQNFPNPFNPATIIRYQVGAACNVHLAVYDLLGREVAVVVNEHIQPGIYEARFDGTSFASGVYVYRLTTGSFTVSRRLLLLK
jgi:hypothetical protein